MTKFTISARSVPECQSFLKIRWPDEDFLSIEEFLNLHPDPTLDDLQICDIQYRNIEKNYRDYLSEYVSFTERLALLPLGTSWLIVEPTIKAAHFFSEKVADCLQNARFFAIKSNLLLDPKETSIWKYGYLAQFSTRCIYFGTAATWYSNTFDQLLQVVYWAYELYTAANDRDGKPYDDSWNVPKIMTFCTYEFVVAELKKRNLWVVRKALTSCSGQIQEVRTWANYIKHKGGIEYSHLQPEPPMKVFFFPANMPEGGKDASVERFALKNFKSPIEIDIDAKMDVIEKTHIALFECASMIIREIDFDKYIFKIGS